MKTIGLRRLLGLASVAVLLGAMVVVSYGATIDGTDRADVLASSGAGDEIFGLGGDDTITVTHDVTVFAGPGSDNIAVSGTGGGNLFGEDGPDTLRLNGTGSVTANGGRGDDFFNVTAAIPADSELIDGPGQDTITDSDGTNAYTVKLVADNEGDTVILAGGQTILVAKGSGRDVIDCGGSGTVFLNGNRKATDTMGNNLRQAALLGGTAESNCGTIIP